MITNDEVFDRLSAANPQPDISDLVPTTAQFNEFLRELEEGPVETITKPPEYDKKPIGRGLLTAVSAFALILIVVGAAWLLTRDGEFDTPPATETPATTTVPEEIESSAPVEETPAVGEASQAVLDEFVATYNAGDIQGYMNLFVPGVVTVLGDKGGRPSPNGPHSGNDFNRDLPNHGAKIAWEMDMGTTLALSDCEGDLVVTCRAEYADFYTSALLGGDATRLVLGIEDGKIVSYRETALQGESIDNMDANFDEWLQSASGYGVSGPIFITSVDIRYSRDSARHWQVFGRLYLESLGYEVDQPDFLTGVSLEDAAVAIEFADAFASGNAQKWAAMLPADGFTYSPDGPTIQGDDVVRTAEWETAFNGTMELASCSPRFASSIVCTYLIQNDFLRTGSYDPRPVDWTFAVVDGQLTEVTVFDARRRDILTQTEALATWAAENRPDVTVLVDADTGEFVHTVENAAAVATLLNDFWLSNQP